MQTVREGITLSQAIIIQQQRNWLEGERSREIERENRLALRRQQERFLDKIWKAFTAWFVAETGIVDMEDAKISIDIESYTERLIPSGGERGDFTAYEGVDVKWTFPDLPGDISYVGDFFTQPDGSIRAAPQRDGAWLARRNGEEVRCYHFENAVIFAKGLEREAPADDTSS